MSKTFEPLLGDRVPLEDHIADNVVLTKGNGTLAMFEVGGVCPDTADERDLTAWFDQFHNALKNIAADDIEITIYQCRGEAPPESCEAGLHTAPFARDFDQAYRDNLFRGLLYENRLFLAVQVHPPAALAQSIIRWFSAAPSDPRAGIEERTRRLEDICSLLRVQLGAFGLRRLGYVTRGQLIFDELPRRSSSR